MLHPTNIEIDGIKYWYYELSMEEHLGKPRVCVTYYTQKPCLSDANHNLCLYFEE